jgi:hypothetical protein
MIQLFSKWLIAKANTITATFFGGLSSISYVNIKTHLLQINLGQWGIDLLLRVVEVGVVGAVGAFSGLVVKHLFEKYFIKK